MMPLGLEFCGVIQWERTVVVNARVRALRSRELERRLVIYPPGILAPINKRDHNDQAGAGVVYPGVQQSTLLIHLAITTPAMSYILPLDKDLELHNSVIKFWWPIALLYRLTSCPSQRLAY